MIIVKVQGENVQEDIIYLKYNGYGDKIMKLWGNTFLCLGGTRKFQVLGDVHVMAVVNAFLSNKVSVSELEYLAENN